MVFGFIGYIHNKPYNCKPGGVRSLAVVNSTPVKMKKIKWESVSLTQPPERVKSPGTSRICFLTLHAPPMVHHSTPLWKLGEQQDQGVGDRFYCKIITCCQRHCQGFQQEGLEVDEDRWNPNRVFLLIPGPNPSFRGPWACTPTFSDVAHHFRLACSSSGTSFDKSGFFFFFLNLQSAINP